MKNLQKESFEEAAYKNRIIISKIQKSLYKKLIEARR